MKHYLENSNPKDTEPTLPEDDKDSYLLYCFLENYAPEANHDEIQHMCKSIDLIYHNNKNN